MPRRQSLNYGDEALPPHSRRVLRARTLGRVARPMSAEVAIIERDELALANDPIAYTEMALGRAVGWLREARSADELREAKAYAATMETFIRERELGFDAQRNAAEMVTRCQVEIAKIERAAVGPSGQHRSSSTPEEDAPVTGGRRAVEDKTLAEAEAEEIEQAIAEVRAEGKSPTPGAVARKVAGPRAVKQESHLLVGIVRQARLLGDLLPHVDQDVIDSIPKENRETWKTELQSVRAQLSRLINGL
jgi:hypothetical protein